MVENLCDSILNRLKLRKPKDFDKFRKIALSFPFPMFSKF